MHLIYKEREIDIMNIPLFGKSKDEAEEDSDKWTAQDMEIDWSILSGLRFRLYPEGKDRDIISKDETINTDFIIIGSDNK